MIRDDEVRIAAETFVELDSEDLTEDRFEYSREDFVSSYPSLTPRSIDYLVALVRRYEGYEGTATELVRAFLY